ncbi:hypothetical protein J4225_00045 [Candidatus Pacearchaeota archaeon]|nr:hypothetical protein [Candidatus Pacearchaeota archaeon]
MQKKAQIGTIIIAVIIIGVVVFSVVFLNKVFGEDFGSGNSKDTDKNKNFCSDKSRNADACITLYKPVCGYSNDAQKIKTYSNSCVACQNSEVEYYASGEC